MWYQKWCLGSAVIRDTRVLSDPPQSRLHINYLAELARKAAAGEATTTTTTEPDDGEAEMETGRSEVEEVDALEAVEDLREMGQNEAIEAESRQRGERGDESEELERKEDGVAESQAATATRTGREMSQGREQGGRSRSPTFCRGRWSRPPFGRRDQSGRVVVSWRTVGLVAIVKCINISSLDDRAEPVWGSTGLFSMCTRTSHFVSPCPAWGDRRPFGSPQIA
jgi:hypothetical protein